VGASATASAVPPLMSGSWVSASISSLAAAIHQAPAWAAPTGAVPSLLHRIMDCDWVGDRCTILVSNRCGGNADHRQNGNGDHDRQSLEHCPPPISEGLMRRGWPSQGGRGRSAVGRVGPRIMSCSYPPVAQPQPPATTGPYPMRTRLARYRGKGPTSPGSRYVRTSSIGPRDSDVPRPPPHGGDGGRCPDQDGECQELGSAPYSVVTLGGVSRGVCGGGGG
jgi:hypothetical protein